MAGIERRASFSFFSWARNVAPTRRRVPTADAPVRKGHRNHFGPWAAVGGRKKKKSLKKKKKKKKQKKEKKKSEKIFEPAAGGSRRLMGGGNRRWKAATRNGGQRSDAPWPIADPMLKSFRHFADEVRRKDRLWRCCLLEGVRQRRSTGRMR